MPVPIGYARNRAGSDERGNYDCAPNSNTLDNPDFFVRLEKAQKEEAYYLSLSQHLASTLRFTDHRRFDGVSDDGDFEDPGQTLEAGAAVMPSIDDDCQYDEQRDHLNFSPAASRWGARVEWINKCMDGRRTDLDKTIDDNYDDWRSSGVNNMYPGAPQDRPHDHNGLTRGQDEDGPAYVVANFPGRGPPVRITLDCQLAGHWGSDGADPNGGWDTYNRYRAQLSTATKQSTFFVFSQKLRAAQDVYNKMQEIDLMPFKVAALTAAIAAYLYVPHASAVWLAALVVKLWTDVGSAAGAAGVGNAAQGDPAPPAMNIPVRCVSTGWNADPGDSQTAADVQRRIMSWHRAVMNKHESLMRPSMQATILGQATCFLDVPEAGQGMGCDVHVGDGDATRHFRLGTGHLPGNGGHEGCAHVHGMLFTTEEFVKFTNDRRGLTKSSAQVLMDLAVHLVRFGFNDQVWTYRNPENNGETRQQSNCMGLRFDFCTHAALYEGCLGATDFAKAFHLFYYAANGGVNHKSTPLKFFKRMKEQWKLQACQLRRDSGNAWRYGGGSGAIGLLGATAATADLPPRQQRPNPRSTRSPAWEHLSSGLFGPQARRRDLHTLHAPDNLLYFKVFTRKDRAAQDNDDDVYT